MGFPKVQVAGRPLHHYQGRNLRSSYRADIDGLRALSVALVVAFHAGITGVGGGYVGVDVFFVVSGYLITGLLLAEHDAHGRISLSNFFARRMRRLLPLASLVVVASVVAGVWLAPPLRRADVVGDARAATLYVANLRFADQAVAYSDTEVTDSFLTHYWSLSIEEQYYVLWPMIVIGLGFFARRRFPHRLRAVMGGAVGLVVVGSLWSSIVNTGRLGPAAYYVTHTRLWEIGVGALLAIALPPALARLARVSAVATDSLAALGLFGIFAGAVHYGPDTPYPGSAALVPVLGAAAVIASGAARATRVSRFLSLRPLPLIGRWSYAWYLWHWPAIGVGLLLNRRAGEPWSPGVVTAGAVAASLLIAVASHVLVENPVRRAPAFQQPPFRSFALGSALMVVSLLAGTAGLRVFDDGTTAVAAGTTAHAMSPAEAAGDTVRIEGADSCHATYFDTRIDPGCVFGDPYGQLSVVLIGDSHAQQWLPSLDAAGRERGWRVISWTKSACTLIDVRLLNTKLERPYDECEEWRNEIAEALAAEGTVDVVVLTNSAALHRMILDDAGRLIEDPDVIAGAWEEGALAAFRVLADHAAAVVRLGDTPWAREDVPVCVSEHAEDPAACSFERDWNSERDRNLIAAEQAAAETLGIIDEFAFLGVSDLVCPGYPCQVVRPDGTIVFRDQHHITQTLALQLAVPLGDRLTDAIVGRAPRKRP